MASCCHCYLSKINCAKEKHNVIKDMDIVTLLYPLDDILLYFIHLPNVHLTMMSLIYVTLILIKHWGNH